MANLVALENATVVYGTTAVLDAVSTGVGTGQRIGVVGRNGGGKSTLLRVLAGDQAADAGRVTRAGGTTVGLLSQDDTLDPAWTVREAVVGDLPEHVWAGDARIRDVLTGLLGGVGAPLVGGLDAVIGPLSGGERRRLALARLLVGDPDLLLLDEPTNHLDVEGVAWLADHLVTRRTRPDASVVAVTHDRWFLDAVAMLTWEVTDGTVQSYGTPRQGAGGPLSEDIMKCRLEPMRRSDYPVTFTDQQWNRLQQAFPGGVCDYSKPGVGQRDTIGWLTYQTRRGWVIYGGKPMGPAPRSRPVQARR